MAREAQSTTQADPREQRALAVMDRLFALAGLALAALFVWTTAAELGPEWGPHQRAYARLLSSAPHARGLRAPQGIQQLHAQGLGLVDRCTSCHLGADKPGSPPARAPLAPHPGSMHELHPPERFGCSSCHDGQGRATSKDKAHGLEANWGEPLLVGRTVQASCAQCHARATAPRAPDLRRGLAIMRRRNCAGCHQVPDLDGGDGRQGHPEDDDRRFGPDLTRIAEKTTREWAFAWLKRPAAQLAGARMPDFGLSDTEAASLTKLLFAAPPPTSRPATLEERGAPRAEAGRALFSESRCISCHAVQRKGGTLAPELARVGSKVERRWLEGWLARPKAHDPGTIMPRFRLSAAEIAAVADYVMEEFEDEGADSWRAGSRAALAREDGRSSVAAGRKLALHYNCAGCHTIPGLKAAKIGPEHSELGVKPVARIDFGLKRSLPRTRLAYLREKLRDPRGFSKGLRMPRFDLDAEEREAVVVTLLSFKDRGYPPSVRAAGIRRPWLGRPPPGPVGELFRELSCLECHQLDGRGGTLAPDLSYEGSQVERTWLERFLKQPTTLRPSLIERMVQLRLRDDEVKLLVEYLASARRLDGVPLAPATDAASIAQGRRLFHERYACPSCHISPHGARGYLGPDLSAVGSRLQRGWIELQLLAPTRYRPQSIEPRLGVAPADARSLAAYLSTLRAPVAREEAPKARRARSGATNEEVAP
jgi:mono/diheme cytochrome c family protein